MSLSTSQKNDDSHPTSIPLGGVAAKKSSAIPPLPERPEPATSSRTASTEKPGDKADVRSKGDDTGAQISTLPKGAARGKVVGSKVEEKVSKDVDKRTLKWAGVVLDTLLVLMVIGVVFGGGYYLEKQWERYRVPGVMELTQAECMELCEQREALQEAANHADEQILMRRKLAHLENKLAEFSQLNDQLRASISDQQNRVLALQHEIRQSDRDSRNVARGLLPGLPIGNISTKRGRSYTQATISRLNGKRLSVRTPDGAATFPTSELIRDNLPTIVLYALGYVDLVDMSDFTTDGTPPSPTTPPNTRLRKVSHKAQPQTDTDYTPASTGPVVDTDANKTSTSVGGEEAPSANGTEQGDVWQAPTGDLPL